MAPFGGVNDSGYGRFGGTAGIESFTEQRWVTIQHSGRPAYPFQGNAVRSAPGARQVAVTMQRRSSSIAAGTP